MLGVFLCFGSGCVAGADGGPHPEPPDRLGPPASGVDGGVPTDNPVQESPLAGAGGASGAASGGAGGAAGVGGSGGDSVPPAGMDASIDGGWDDEDAGALR